MEDGEQYVVDGIGQRLPLWLLFKQNSHPSGRIGGLTVSAPSDPVIFPEGDGQYHVDGTGQRWRTPPAPLVSGGWNSPTGWTRNTDILSTWTSRGASRTIDRPSSWSNAPVAGLEATGGSGIRVAVDPDVSVTQRFSLSDPPSSSSPVIDGICPERVLSVMGEAVDDGWVEYHEDDVSVTWRVPEGDGSTVLPPTAPGNQPARGDDSPVSEEDHE
jgi:hypothetical protein